MTALDRTSPRHRLLAPLDRQSLDGKVYAAFESVSRCAATAQARRLSSTRCSRRFGVSMPIVPIASPRTMQEIYSKSLASTSFTLVMLGIAASMALALGIIGIYGVISYAVSQRTREIGIRLALGAQKTELRWMFVRSALTLTAIGIVIGLGAAVGVARLMRTLLFGVSPLDPIELCGSAVDSCFSSGASPAFYRLVVLPRSIRWTHSKQNDVTKYSSDFDVDFYGIPPFARNAQRMGYHQS